MEFFFGKKVLVTGASGLIGSNLVDALMKDGAQVVALGRNEKKLMATFPEYVGNKNFSIVEHDVCEPFPDMDGVDYIFHAAGPMERNIVLNRPVDVVRPNIIGIMNILEYLRSGHSDIRLVVFSSVTVYNNTTDKDLSVLEPQTTNAISLDADTASYAESKRMIEVIAKAYKKQYDLNVVIARFSTVYGYTRNVPDSAFYDFLDKAMKGEKITLNSTGFGRRDNIYVDDAVSGLLTVALKGGAGESYNVSCGGESGNYVAVDEIAKAIARTCSEVMGRPMVKVNVKDSESRRPGLILDNSKLKSLGWNLKYSLDEGLAQTLKAFINRN
jgi:nucleoside-diphosphate-sugar epimerase